MSEAISRAGGRCPRCRVAHPGCRFPGHHFSPSLRAQRSNHRPAGYVARSDTQQRRHVFRWVSLRSTHPTKLRSPIAVRRATTRH